MTQSEFIKDYFIKNPKRDIPHPEIVDFVTNEYLKRTGNVFRDPDRAIRLLYQNGFLIKVKKGVYRYDPDYVKKKEFTPFTANQIKEIFKKDGYKCVICGMGTKDGVEIHADHKIPRDKGGVSDVSNGQTLCSVHNFRKKNYNATESGKMFFIHLYKSAKILNDKEILEFCKYILNAYDKFGINGHITWEK